MLVAFNKYFCGCFEHAETSKLSYASLKLRSTSRIVRDAGNICRSFTILLRTSGSIPRSAVSKPQRWLYAFPGMQTATLRPSKVFQRVSFRMLLKTVNVNYYSKEVVGQLNISYYSLYFYRLSLCIMMYLFIYSF